MYIFYCTYFIALLLFYLVVLSFFVKTQVTFVSFNITVAGGDTVVTFVAAAVMALYFMVFPIAEKLDLLFCCCFCYFLTAIFFAITIWFSFSLFSGVNAVQFKLFFKVLLVHAMILKIVSMICMTGSVCFLLGMQLLRRLSIIC